MPSLQLDLKALMQGPPLLTLAIAESLTCGQVQARVGAVSGASSFFRGGITAYTLDAKVQLLGVERKAAVAVNSVSAEIARQMARGAAAAFAADLAVATTGYAEAPTAGEEAEPFAYWAVVHREHTHWHERTGRIVCGGRVPRLQVQAMVAEAVLGELLAHLRSWREARR